MESINKNQKQRLAKFGQPCFTLGDKYVRYGKLIYEIGIDKRGKFVERPNRFVSRY